MATKTRTSSSVRPVYDYFEPSTDLSENDEAHFLRILLPGFTRDQIRITFMNYTRTLNVSGERPIDSENNIWVRFDQSYPIPQNCDEGKLKANLSEGVLIITMAKKILSQHSPQTKAQQKGPFSSKTQEPRPDRKAPEDIYQEAQKKPTAPRIGDSKLEKDDEKIPQMYAPTHAEELKPGSGEKIQEPRPMKAQERSPHKFTPRLEGLKLEEAHAHIPQGTTRSTKSKEQKPKKAHEEETPFKFRIPRGKEDLIKKIEDDEGGLKDHMPPESTKDSKLKKGQDEIEPTPTIIKVQRKLNDEKPLVGPSEKEQRPTLKVAPKKPKDENPKKGGEEIEKEKGTEKEEEKSTGKPEKMFKEKEIKRRQKTTATTEKEKETLPTKDDIVSIIGEGIRQVSSSTSEVVTKISKAKWKEEEKLMLVNMCAAILVIAALGAYVYYKIASSGST